MTTTFTEAAAMGSIANLSPIEQIRRHVANCQDPAGQLRSALQKVAGADFGTSKTHARCPFHDDGKTPSLSIVKGDNGWPGYHCFGFPPGSRSSGTRANRCRLSRC